MTRSQRILQRAARRSRSVERVKMPVPTALRAFDPLVRPTGSKLQQLIRSIVILIAAVALHAFMLTAIFAANRAASSIERPTNRDAIEVAIVEPPPPPPPVEPPPPEPQPVVEETAPPPPKKPKPKPKEPPKPEPPPPDPIDLPPDPPKTPPKKQPRRIVGLSLESTVQGGGGPSFATGNTRAGRTEKTAEDKTNVRKLDKVAVEPKTNRSATRIPGIGRGKIKAPQPRGRQLEPAFPPLLRAQNIEGSVTVEVRIDEKGRVISARVIEASRFDEFQKSALEAAKKQVWMPATQGGKPIQYTLTYTYRFRITD